ncbi:hypothetical protein A5686_25705 [Mycobacterium sp. E2479]|nr:hypothetical protein A5686_25705 [Mycobacterium sp. E2479]
MLQRGLCRFALASLGADACLFDFLLGHRLRFLAYLDGLVPGAFELGVGLRLPDRGLSVGLRGGPAPVRHFFCRP